MNLVNELKALGYPAALIMQIQQWIRPLRADAWDEGYYAGHRDARAVQETYPEPTPNPYYLVEEVSPSYYNDQDRKGLT